MLDPKHQLALRERPAGLAVMRQRWRDLLFLHFACDPALVAPLLPQGLSVDTFPDESGEEKAWIGLVPFLMKDVRWAFMPRVPGTHTFPETNVRTYVHREGREPGVWFFSLDAMNRLAVATARRAFSLPYFHAAMSLTRTEGRVVYQGERHEARYRIEAEVGSSLPPPVPGTREFFLVERYLLYAARGDGLYSGRVFHPPYGLCALDDVTVDETLARAAGLPERPYASALFSQGVDVEIFPLRRIASNFPGKA